MGNQQPEQKEEAKSNVEETKSSGIVLSDETKVQDVTWARFKLEAMEDEFDLDDPDYAFTLEEKETL